MWAVLYTKAGKWAAAVIGLLTALAVVFVKGRASGKEAAQAKQAKVDQQATVDSLHKVEERNNVEAEVTSLPDGAAVNELRDQWSRD